MLFDSFWLGKIAVDGLKFDESGRRMRRLLTCFRHDNHVQRLIAESERVESGTYEQIITVESDHRLTAKLTFLQGWLVIRVGLFDMVSVATLIEPTRHR